MSDEHLERLRRIGRPKYAAEVLPPDVPWCQGAREMVRQADIARRFGVSYQAVQKWRRRSTFPKPIEGAIVPCWYWDEVRRWKQTRNA